MGRKHGKTYRYTYIIPKVMFPPSDSLLIRDRGEKKFKKKKNQPHNVTFHLTVFFFPMMYKYPKVSFQKVDMLISIYSALIPITVSLRPDQKRKQNFTFLTGGYS